MPENPAGPPEDGSHTDTTCQTSQTQQRKTSNNFPKCGKKIKPEKKYQVRESNALVPNSNLMYDGRILDNPRAEGWGVLSRPEKTIPSRHSESLSLLLSDQSESESLFLKQLSNIYSSVCLHANPRKLKKKLKWRACMFGGERVVASGWMGGEYSESGRPVRRWEPHRYHMPNPPNPTAQDIKQLSKMWEENQRKLETVYTTQL